MIQELIPATASASSLLRVLQGRRAGGEDGGPPAPPAPARLRPREHLRRDRRRARARGALRALPRAIDYYGLAELEYKFDERDSRYKLLDVNPRTWGYHSIGRRPASTSPTSSSATSSDSRSTPVRARDGVRWIRLTTDVPARGRCPRPSEWRLFCRSVRNVDTEAVFARDDPLPALAEMALLPHLYRTRGTRGWRGSTVEVRPPVAIVGAGPYASSTAPFLRRAGVETRVFGEVMGFWKAMPKGMYPALVPEGLEHLRSGACPHGSTRTRRAPAEARRTDTLEDFVEIRAWFRGQIEIEVDPRQVDAVANGSGFRSP